MNFQKQNTLIQETVDTQFKIEIIKTEQELFQIKDKWDQLVDISRATFYQKSYWLFSWWKYYHRPEKDELFCLTLYDNNVLIGIIPLYLHYETFLGKKIFKRIYFLGSDILYGCSFGIFNDNSPSDYLDIIAHPDYEKKVLESFVHYLSKHYDMFDEILLNNINNKSVTYKLLPEILKNKNISFKLNEGEICPYIKSTNSLEEFFNSRTQSVKRRFTQSWKEAQSGKLFKIKMSNSFDLIHKDIDDIKKLHQTKWNRVGFPGFFGDQRYEKFFDEFLKLAYPEGVLWCGTAYNDNRTIAGRLAFRYKDRYYDYLSGIDDTAPEAKRRPGLVLLIAMINDAIENKIPIIDLLRGDESYKKDFTELYETNWNLRIYKTYSAKYYLIFLLLVLKFIAILFYREFKLIKIWLKTYIFPKSIIGYVTSRTSAVMKKILKHIYKRD